MKPNRRGYDLLSKMADELTASIAALDEDELRALLRAAAELTTTNCGWQSYAIRPAVAKIAQTRLDYLSRLAKDPRAKR